MCYKSYVGCSTDFEKSTDELRKRKNSYVLHQTSATWANVSITPGRKRATKYSRLRAFRGLQAAVSKCRRWFCGYAASRRRRPAKTKRTYVLHHVLHPRMKMCYKSSFSLMNRVLQNHCRFTPRSSAKAPRWGGNRAKGESGSKNLRTSEDHGWSFPAIIEQQYVLQSVLHSRMKMCYRFVFPQIKRVLQNQSRLYTVSMRC